MSTADVITIAREGLITVLLVAGPMLGASLLVGLIVSIFQATTQLQEQTLSFVPKILAVLAAGVFFGPWMMRVMIEFTSKILGNLSQFVG